MLLSRLWVRFNISMGEPEASFTLCCDVDDTQAFEITQLSQFRAPAEKNSMNAFFFIAEEGITWDYL